MKAYETVYIFDTTVAEDAVQEKIDGYHELITSAGGEVTALDIWGAQRFAYPIARKTSGNYVVAQFTLDPAELPEYERRLQLDDDLLRYLLVVDEGLPTAPVSVSTRERVETDDEDEEGEED